MSVPDFVTESAALLTELQSIRRELHTFPELGNDTPLTQAYVVDALAGLPLEITLGKDCTSVVGVLRGPEDGPVVLLRGDMDGLPVVEDTGLPYASTNGNMHGCGHDLHTTGMIGAARLLSAHAADLPGTVIFMFQPGEEGAGGAQIMLDEGLLDVAGKRPVGAYGIHVVSSGEPYGQLITRPGTLQAGANVLEITVHGKGGHGSQPQGAVDPVPVLTEIVAALQAYVTRRVSVFDPVVITVTQLSAGTAVNVIPSEAKLGASIRTLSAASLAQLDVDLPRLADGIASAHGCTVTTDFRHHYPVTVNDPVRTERVLEVLGEVFGSDRVVRAADPIMGSEDFSFVLQQVPGTFVLIQAGPKDAAEAAVAPTNHSAYAVFDDEILADSTAALCAMAWTALTDAA